jgi:mannose-6-phosphate isomerase
MRVADDRLGPWILAPNRVARFYRGGALLEQFGDASSAPGQDGNEPEDWLGSVTRTWAPPGSSTRDEGLSQVTVGGRDRTIAELLEADPELVAGRALVERAGSTTGILAKLLDAAERLPGHAHPSRAFAHRHLGTPFGKTEAWHVLAVREHAAASSTIRLGFRRDVTRDELLGWIAEQRTDELLGALHERPARPGETWLVPGGTPHAIGAGVFILELQEPTDFSIVPEVAGFPIEPDDAHLRLGWQTAVDAIDRRALTDDEVAALRYVPGPPPIAGALARERLSPPAADPYLRLERWTATSSRWPPIRDPAFLVAIVTRGEGEARVHRGGSLALRRGTIFAVPAAGLPGLDLRGDARLLACLPPRPDDLARDWPR